MILDELHSSDRHMLKVSLCQPFCIYSKKLESHSSCYDVTTNKELNIADIDDSYNLDICKEEDSLSIFIPTTSICTLKLISDRNDIEFEIYYGNIVCILSLDDDEIFDQFFQVVNN